ncbi:MAG: LysR family transcriptional regulator [Vibrio sp.]|uniref:LysR family transcriptional regulator n=1 Tax=Vibrio sp. TaxID=678 RepID=UPI003A88C0E2
MENKVNLNLISIVILLKRHKSMRVVAKILGKSESAISKDLSKLRYEFSDELFVKTRNGFEPTYFLNQIYNDLENTYTKLINLVNIPLSFEPSSYTNTISIAVVESEYDYIVNHLYPRLVKNFPNAKLHFEVWNQDSLDKILSGKIKCGVHYQNKNISKDVYQKNLKSEQIVTAVHKSHNITHWSQIKSTPFIYVEIPGWNDYQPRYQDYLPIELWKDISYAVTVGTLKSAFNIVSQSKLAIQTPIRYLNDDFSIIPYPSGTMFDTAYTFYCPQVERHNPLINHIYSILLEVYELK